MRLATAAEGGIVAVLLHRVFNPVKLTGFNLDVSAARVVVEGTEHRKLIYAAQDPFSLEPLFWQSIHLTARGQIAFEDDMTRSSCSRQPLPLYVILQYDLDAERIRYEQGARTERPLVLIG